jgi:hypothetical protein
MGMTFRTNTGNVKCTAYVDFFEEREAKGQLEALRTGYVTQLLRIKREAVAACLDVL